MECPNITVNINESTVGIVCVGQKATLSTGNVYINSTSLETNRTHQDFHLLKTVKSFQGRCDELMQLNSWLFKDKIKRKMVVICGLPGYGKTELARRFCHQCKEQELVRSILWLNAETPSVLEQSLRNLLRWLGAKDKAELDVQSVVQAVQQYFSTESHLFVIDNALDRRNVLGFEPEGECCCVFTSHLEDWGDDVPALKLMPLSLDSAVDVLRAELLQRFHDEDLEQYKHLAELLSCVPLALQVAAAYVRQEFDDLGQLFHVSDYVERLQVSSTEVIDQPLPHPSTSTYDKTLLQAIQISLKKIHNTKNYDSKLASDILHICSYLNPEEIFYSTLIEISYLKNVLNNEHEQNKKKVMKKACALLCKYSFISDVNEKISIHRLIQLSVIQVNSQISQNPVYFSCLELLLDTSIHAYIHSHFILKYAEYRSNIFHEFYTKYQSDILNKITFFSHIINSNCALFLVKIFNELEDRASDVINARCLLHCAVRCQQHRILELLLEKYELNLEKRDGNEDTALIVAARKLDLYSIKILTLYKADINAVDADGDSVLHAVIYASGSAENFSKSLEAVEAVRWLVMGGAHINAVGHRDRSLVHTASMVLNPVLLRCLVLDFGCDVNAVTDFKHTPLFYVAMSSSADKGRQRNTVKCLLDLGARRDVKDAWGKTPVEHTRERDQRDLADYIDNPSAEIQESEPVVDELLSLVGRGDLKALTRLLDELGERAVSISNESCLLYEAVRHANCDVLETLLARGVDADCRTTSNDTPLNRAAWELDIRAIQLLVNCGADVNAVDTLGRSVLHRLVLGAGGARRAGRVEMLQWLVERGARPEALTTEGRSLLHAASLALSPDLIRCLVTKYNLDVNTEDKDRRTPLFRVSAGLSFWNATESRGLSTAACLLELGAHVQVLDANGNTVAENARTNGYRQLAMLLDTAHHRCDNLPV